MASKRDGERFRIAVGSGRKRRFRIYASKRVDGDNNQEALFSDDSKTNEVAGQWPAFFLPVPSGLNAGKLEKTPAAERA